MELEFYHKNLFNILYLDKQSFKYLFVVSCFKNCDALFLIALQLFNLVLQLLAFDPRFVGLLNCSLPPLHDLLLCHTGCHSLYNEIRMHEMF